MNLNALLEETKTKLLGVDGSVDGNISLTGKVVIAYDEDDLLDALKGVRSYPAVGIVYEGMRSMPEVGPTAKVGVSVEVVVSFVLIQQGPAISASDQKRTKAIDYLEQMRNQFLNQKSTVTSHFWKFMVEAPVTMKGGMVVWSQRWSVPGQLKPTKLTPYG
jgi:hypothetical protein